MDKGQIIYRTGAAADLRNDSSIPKKYLGVSF